MTPQIALHRDLGLDVKCPVATSGNIALEGCIVKTAGVDESILQFSGPAKVFESQDATVKAILSNEVKAGDVVVIRYEGPRGGPGMQEMLYPTSYLKSRGLGQACALLTDGRMSGASGKVAAAIHLTPEAVDGGPIAKLRNGDMLRVDCEKGTVDYLGDATEFLERTNAERPKEADGTGRELFAHMRRAVGPADQGGAVFW